LIGIGDLPLFSGQADRMTRGPGRKEEYAAD
jgi:hypothetical protein